MVKWDCTHFKDCQCCAPVSTLKFKWIKTKNKYTEMLIGTKLCVWASELLLCTFAWTVAVVEE